MWPWMRHVEVMGYCITVVRKEYLQIIADCLLRALKTDVLMYCSWDKQMIKRLKGHSNHPACRLHVGLNWMLQEQNKQIIGIRFHLLIH